MAEKKTLFTITRTRQDRQGNSYDEVTPNVPGILKFGVGVVVGIILLAILWPIQIIGPTERGVVKTFGEVGDDILQPGLRWKAPIAQQIQTYDLTPQITNLSIAVGDDAPVSKDQQTIGVKGAFAWMFDENEINTLARRFSSIDALKKQVNDIINSAIRFTIGRYNITDIVQEQAKISSEAQNEAIRLLESANIPVTVTQLNLNNWDWTEEYDRQIRETVATRQAVLRTSAEADRIEQENRQKIIVAEAEAQAVVAQADGRKRAAELDAQAAVLRAQGERDAAIAQAEGRNRANALIAQNLSVEIRLRELTIEQTAMDKWNGVRVPNIATLNPLTGVINTPLPGTNR